MCTLLAKRECTLSISVSEIFLKMQNLSLRFFRVYTRCSVIDSCFLTAFGRRLPGDRQIYWPATCDEPEQKNRKQEA